MHTSGLAPGIADLHMATDFHHRISIAGWVMALVLAMSLIWTLPEFIWFSPIIGGTQITLKISPNMIEVLVAGMVSLAVTDSILQIHPRLAPLSGYERVRIFWLSYCLPVAQVVVVVVAQPLPTTVAVAALVLMGAVAVYILTMFLLYEALDPSHPYAGQFEFLLHGIAYVVAFMLFLLVYQAKGRLLITVPLLAGTALLLAIELLRNAGTRQRDILRHALVVGLVVGEVALALTFASFSELTKSVLLIWTFFLLVNICQHGFRQNIRPRLLAEYGIFSMLVILLIYLREAHASVLVFH